MTTPLLPAAATSHYRCILKYVFPLRNFVRVGVLRTKIKRHVEFCRYWRRIRQSVRRAMMIDGIG